MESLVRAIDALAAAVFVTVPFFGGRIQAIVLWLALPMAFFTVWLGFINLRGIGRAFRELRRRPAGHAGNAAGTGEISPFAALATALAGTIGLGNIAGVAIAITSGGPGAIFWMFAIGWCAMALKMAEVTIGLKYRETTADGRVLGGPMYVLKNGLRARGWPRTGLALGGAYAFFALFGAIPMVQVNQSYAAMRDVTGIAAPWTYGIALAVLVALVTFGSAPWLGRVASRLTPLKVAVYLGGVCGVLIVNHAAIPAALAAIWHGAWSADAATGGAIGAFVVGMRRAVFSSEAGVGSAVMAHSLARTDTPASEGFVALLEPLFGTVIVCSLGGLAMVAAGTWHDHEGIAVVTAAFATVAPWFPFALALAVFLFAYSTLCAWGFYGLQAWAYFFGMGRWSTRIYRVLYVAALPVAAVLDIEQVINLVDSAFFLMAVPNVIALYLFAGEIRREVRGAEWHGDERAVAGVSG